jgi:hypothetical protein
MTKSPAPASPRMATLDLLRRASDDRSWILSRVQPAHELAAMAPGEWNIRQVLAHMVMYEERYTLPTLALMASGLPAVGLDITGTESDLQHPSEELAFLTAHELHTRLLALEARQQELVQSMTDADFVAPRRSLWGPQSAQWVLEKSFGHHWEHGVTMFYITHFYQMAAHGLRSLSLDQRQLLESFD